MARDKYFRDELAFLKEQGKQFSEIYPQLSRYLNGRNTDPDVERLLEGFAFLTGRLREKVEDEFPELTHSLISMLWPNYLRPIPSLCIVRFEPDGKAISHHQVIAKGTKVDSRQVMQTVCRFSTCRPVDVYPLHRGHINVSHGRESSHIDIDMALEGKETIGNIGLDQLRFFLGADNYRAQMLYFWLMHHLARIEIQAGERVFTIPARCLRSVGFSSDEAMLPYPTNAHDGYRILQEYLTYPAGFYFVDLTDLATFLPPDISGRFTLRWVFNKLLPTDVRVSDECFELYCTPAINLFEHDAEPIDLTGKQSEYRIMPSARVPAHYEIFSVDQVQGWLDSQNPDVRTEPRLYTPFESFQHEIERAHHRRALYYRTRVKDSVRGDGFEHFISFVRSDETHCIGMTEAVSIQLTCSNRQLPIELGKGDIQTATENSPTYATFSNITEPTQPLRPILDGSLLWTLISNMSLNYLSLLSKDALRAVLRAYDFRALVDRQAERVAQLRLDGIKMIETKPVEKVIRGLPVRGIQSQLTLDQRYFGSEGDVYLFGTVLSRFFALYASINSFHELVVINAENQERYTWDIQHGLQPLI